MLNVCILVCEMLNETTDWTKVTTTTKHNILEPHWNNAISDDQAISLITEGSGGSLPHSRDLHAEPVYQILPVYTW